MRFAVDGQRTHAANSFAAIGVERDRLLAVIRQSLVDDVEHFEKRHVFVDVIDLVIDETAFCLLILLTPDAKTELHL